MTTPALNWMNPFVGPRPFLPGERLYGRDREMERLLNLLIAERIVLLYSPSGAGKTSLIQASLMASLAAEDFQVLPVMRVSAEAQLARPIPPRAAPPASDDGLLLSLLGSAPSSSASSGSGARVSQAAAQPSAQISAAPNRYLLSALLALEADRPAAQQLPLADLSSLTFGEYLHGRLGAANRSSGVVLIFDQFEEILTVEPTNIVAKAAFFAQVGEVLRDRRYWALFALREDYLAGLDPYLRPIPTRLNTRFRLDLLRVEAANQALRQPARRLGVDFTAGAAAKLIDDLRRVRVQYADGTVAEEPGAYIEPVQLQVVGYRLWEQRFAKRDERGPGAQITETDITTVGDVNSALAEYYTERIQAIVSELHVNERTIRDWFDRQLITEQATRGQVLQGPSASKGLDNRAIALLVDAHLIRAEKRGGATWFELTHDRLIEPIRMHNAHWRAANFSPLQHQALLWEQQSRPDGLLLRDAALSKAEAWALEHPTDLTETDQAFLKRCQEARAIALRERRNNRIIRWLAFGAFTLAILAFGAMGVAFERSNEATRQQHLTSTEKAIADARRDEAEQQRQTAISRLAQFLAAQANAKLEDNTDLGLLLAIEAARRAQSPFIENVLRHAVRPGSARIYKHSRALTSVALSSDAQRMVTGSEDGSARIWDTSAKQVLRVLQGNSQRLNDVDFSPDGQWVVTASADGTARIWDTDTGVRLRVLTGHRGSVRSAAFSPDGRAIVTAGADRTAKVWNSGTAEMIFELRGHRDVVTSAAFSPDGRRIATTSDDATIRIWDASTGDQLDLIAAPSAVNGAAFSPDGQLVVTGGADGVARVWEAGTGKRILELGDSQGAVTSVAFSPDGRRIITASSDTNVRLWNARTGAMLLLLQGHTDAVADVVFSRDGLLVATASRDTMAYLWQFDLPVLVGHVGVVTCAAFSPDRQQVVTAGSDTTARIWDARTGVELLLLRGHRGTINTVAFSPDGRRVLTASSDGTARIWDANTGAESLVLRAQGAAVASAVWNPDGRRVLTASDDGTARIWDANTGAESLVLRAQGAAVASAVWNPDGRRVLTASDDGAAQVWDVETGKQLIVLREPVDGIRQAAFNPAGQLIVTASGRATARIWDATTGKELRILAGHADRVVSASFSSDGRRIITSSWDKTARIWDTDTGTLLLILDWHTDAVTSAAFSADAQRIITTSADGTARIYYAGFQDVLAQAKQLATRELTPDERKTYLGDVETDSGAVNR